MKVDGGVTVAKPAHHQLPSLITGGELLLQLPEEDGSSSAGFGKQKKASGVWIHFGGVPA